jgi:hypothetical protein
MLKKFFYYLTISMFVHFLYLFDFLYLVVTLYLTFNSFSFFSARAEVWFGRWIKHPFIFYCYCPRIMCLAFFYRLCYNTCLIFLIIVHLRVATYHISYGIDIFFSSFKFLIIMEKHAYYISKIYFLVHLVYFMSLLSLEDLDVACYYFFLHYFFVLNLVLILLRFYPNN